MNANQIELNHIQQKRKSMIFELYPFLSRWEEISSILLFIYTYVRGLLTISMLAIIDFGDEFPCTSTYMTPYLIILVCICNYSFHLHII